MSMMAMLAQGGGGAAAVNAMTTPLVNVSGALPMLGGGAGNSLMPSTKAPTLDQSATSVIEEKEAEKEVVIDRSAEYNEWFGQSKIIEDDEYQTLLDFFDANGKGVKKMELLFRGSEERF